MVGHGQARDDELWPVDQLGQAGPALRPVAEEGLEAGAGGPPVHQLAPVAAPALLGHGAGGSSASKVARTRGWTADGPVRAEVGAHLVDLGEIGLHVAVLVAKRKHLDREAGRPQPLDDQRLEVGAVAGERADPG
jgi:hypothetical protein